MSEQPPPAATPPSPGPAPAKSGNRVLIIIVCVVLGFLLLVGGCVATCTYLVSKKARELSRSAQKNPVFTSLSLAASMSPDVEVVSKDESSGKIVVHNKRTGENVTINANDFTPENISQAVEQMTQGAKAAIASAGTGGRIENAPDQTHASRSGDGEARPGSSDEPRISAGKAEAMAAILKTFPDYVPAYPGGATIEASQNTLGGMRAGNYVFLTADRLDAVMGFYEKKATSSGYSLMGRNGNSNDYGPTASLNLVRTDPQGTITVTAESKEGGRLQVTIVVTELGK
jgi:hypothetical protein